MKKSVRAWGVVGWRGRFLVASRQKKFANWYAHVIDDERRVVPVTITYDDGKPGRGKP